MKTSLPASATLALLVALATAPPLAHSKSPAPGAWRGQSVTEFDADDNKKFDWMIVNDGVMGGLSQGNFKVSEEGTMRFFGDLSLKNNGGFSTVRSQDVELDLSNDLGLLLRVKGDGRTYQARLASDARYRSMEVSFTSEFKTTRGEWQQVKLPFSEFKGSFRGMDLDDKVLDPASIRRVGLLLGDKKEGSFNLEIDWIRTYGKGRGLAASNGNSAPNLVDAVTADDRFKTLAAALTAADLLGVLKGDGPFTVFAPTEDAFAALPEGTVEALLKEESREALTALLTYHVVPARVSAGDALNAGKAATVQGAPLSFALRDGLLSVNDATIRSVDIDGGNGVIHVIDSVLIPPSVKIEVTEQGQSGADCQASSADASEAITAAIEKGVPLYNSGDPMACAEVYQDCIAELASNDRFDDHTRRMLSKVVESGRAHGCPDERAWLYRRTLDAMMVRLHRPSN